MLKKLNGGKRTLASQRTNLSKIVPDKQDWDYKTLRKGNYNIVCFHSGCCKLAVGNIDLGESHVLSMKVLLGVKKAVLVLRVLSL